MVWNFVITYYLIIVKKSRILRHKAYTKTHQQNGLTVALTGKRKGISIFFLVLNSVINDF